MKLFIKRIIIFGAFLLLIASFLQLIISARIKGRTVTGADNLEQTSNINADLIFLGSSRCSVHFDPRFFDTTFRINSVNIGVSGHSEISMASIRLKDYLSRNQPPKFAILSFDPIMRPGDETNNSTAFTDKNKFARYAFLPNKKDLRIVNYFKFNILEKYIPLYSIFKYKLLNDCLLLNKGSNYSKYGYDMHSEKWDTILYPVNDTIKTVFFTKSQIPSITSSLKAFNTLCLQNGIKLLCIQTPFYKVVQASIAFSYPNSICKSLGIPFIDANVGDIRNNMNYFFNSNHLNQVGVAQMNEILKKNEVLNSFLDH